jgi:uncharacterized protein (DUF1810 family)
MESLNHFIDAQDEYGFISILEEIRIGQKTGHWMWFVFPQLRGLGQSERSQYFGLTSLEDAKAYWEHPVLGLRLRESCKSILSSGKTAEDIFGLIDTLKLHSCLTLFNMIADKEPMISNLLERFYSGQLDQKTIDLVAKM